MHIFYLKRIGSYIIIICKWRILKNHSSVKSSTFKNGYIITYILILSVAVKLVNSCYTKQFSLHCGLVKELHIRYDIYKNCSHYSVEFVNESCTPFHGVLIWLSAHQYGLSTLLL